MRHTASCEYCEWQQQFMTLNVGNKSNKHSTLFFLFHKEVILFCLRGDAKFIFCGSFTFATSFEVSSFHLSDVMPEVIAGVFWNECHLNVCCELRNLYLEFIKAQ